MTLSEELQWRGFVNQTTYKDLNMLDHEPITFYWGVDPSADSMQVGNLAAAMMVKAFIKHGHHPVLLVGGATGMIGDPDGKSEERSLKSLDEIAHNKAAIAKQYRQIFGDHEFKLVDNYDWFKDIGYLQFLRDVGKHVPLRQMLARDFIQTRLGEGGSGISYAEFSYVLIQAYDFLVLYKEHGVTLQVCGSDQWGNSIAGVELIRRLAGAEANVYSVPLIVNKSTGKKFGKSEDGAIWLDAGKTSVYKFYQFWLNVDDDGVGDYLKVFTELDKEAVAQVMTEFESDRAGRAAQKRLAWEVTKLVHGQARADSARKVSESLFGGQSYTVLGSVDIDLLKEDLPTARFKRGEDLSDLMVKLKLADSKSEARRFVEQGAIYINGVQTKISDTQHIDALAGGNVIIRKGKNDNAILEIET